MYNDAIELNAYVFKNYSNFLTKEESEILQAIEANHKAESYGMKKMKAYLKKHEAKGKKAAKSRSLAQEQKMFQTQVRNRVLEAHKDEVVINRCPECDNVVKTPRSKQCLWCNHSWHDAAVTTA
ncbi:MAG: hypothetical protein ACYTGH_07705 [Planctomycetota bacterium]|jgi:ssDNA-binding Zn-finger/Zn-ribbon topoisomerase 1